MPLVETSIAPCGDRPFVAVVWSMADGGGADTGAAAASAPSEGQQQAEERPPERPHPQQATPPPPPRRSTSFVRGSCSFRDVPDAVLGDVFDFLSLQSLQVLDCASRFLSGAVRRHAESCTTQGRRGLHAGSLWSGAGNAGGSAGRTAARAGGVNASGGDSGGGGGGGGFGDGGMQFLGQFLHADSPVLLLRKAESLQRAVDLFLSDTRSQLLLHEMFQRNAGVLTSWLAFTGRSMRSLPADNCSLVLALAAASNDADVVVAIFGLLQNLVTAAAPMLLFRGVLAVLKDRMLFFRRPEDDENGETAAAAAAAAAGSASPPLAGASLSAAAAAKNSTGNRPEAGGASPGPTGSCGAVQAQACGLLVCLLILWSDSGAVSTRMAAVHGGGSGGGGGGGGGGGSGGAGAGLISPGSNGAATGANDNATATNGDNAERPRRLLEERPSLPSGGAAMGATPPPPPKTTYMPSLHPPPLTTVAAVAAHFLDPVLHALRVYGLDHSKLRRYVTHHGIFTDIDKCTHAIAVCAGKYQRKTTVRMKSAWW